MIKVGDVEVEWINDPGGKVDGQWKVKTLFWKVYPTEQELEDLVKAATQAIAERRAMQEKNPQ